MTHVSDPSRLRWPMAHVPFPAVLWCTIVCTWQMFVVCVHRRLVNRIEWPTSTRLSALERTFPRPTNDINRTALFTPLLYNFELFTFLANTDTSLKTLINMKQLPAHSVSTEIYSGIARYPCGSKALVFGYTCWIKLITLSFQFTL